MLIPNRPEAERKASDHALLRILLRRSAYTSADLLAQAGPDYERELVIIKRLRKGMIMGAPQLADWENAIASETSALLRWENEGGSLAEIEPPGRHV
ncbi:MAG: hypothetical protein QE484_16645 [Rhizobium sp.]|nr:hypothetical protein [Rhizobium sp.]